ncbi:MAG: hypothetical protein ACOCY7_03240 [Halodesulfurarchaeum sp.]
MSSGRVKTDVLGHESALQYSPAWAGYSIISLRVGLGWVFFQTGVSRILDSTWSSHQFVAGIPEANPFGHLWKEVVASSGWLVDPVFSWGFAVVGAGLLFGVFIKPSAALGTVLMLLAWSTSFTPPGPILTRHLVYVLVLFSLVTFGAGRIAGLDALIEKHPIVERYPLLRWFLG